VDLKRADHPKDETRLAVSLHKASLTANHRLDVAHQTVLVEKAGLSIVDQSTVDVTMTAAGDQTTDLDQKAEMVDRKANHRADVHRGLRMADLAVTEMIVGDRRVAKADLKDLLAEKDDRMARREKKDDLTEIADQLDRKAKAAPNDVKLL
jgi:hypothetical protein